MNGDHIDPTYLLVMLAVVAFGAIIPVVPTGAVVSGAAAIALQQHLWEVPVVVLVGALGAYAGDLATYGALRTAGTPLAERVGWLRRGEGEGQLDRLRTAIEDHEIRTLLVSRLVPGGRIPVLLVASLTGYPWLRFVLPAMAAALLWSVTYASVGVLGAWFLPDPQVAVVAAVVAALVFSLALQAVRARRGVGSDENDA